MKLLKFALSALMLLAFVTLAHACSHHAAPGAANVALAMEPASWVLVSFGLLGGGFLHKRRPAGLNLVSAPQPVTPRQPQTAAASPF